MSYMTLKCGEWRVTLAIARLSWRVSSLARRCKYLQGKRRGLVSLLSACISASVSDVVQTKREKTRYL